MIVYHGTDVKAMNSILKERVLRGDPPLFGVGVCTTLRQAMDFCCMKAGPKTRRVARVLRLEVRAELLSSATPESCGEAVTLNRAGSRRPLHELSLDDESVLGFDILTMGQWERGMRSERQAVKP